MTRYFAQNTPRAGLEHMMMSVPGFQKRGGGMMILSRFCYKPEDVDCRYCLHYRRRSCQVRTCPYIAERLKSGAIEYGQPDPPKPVSGDPHCGRRERRPAQEPGGLLRGRVGHLPAHSVAGTDVFRLPVQRTHAGAYRPEHYGTAAEKLWKRGL